MMSRVNRGSINAKSTAGLTYQTQLLMLNTGPGSKWAKNNGIVIRHCVSGGVQSPGWAGVTISECLNVCAQGAHVCVSRMSKGFTQTLSLLEI